jgi:hypothetical protein
MLLEQFLRAGSDATSGDMCRKQILSLGSGYDTTWFQLQVHPKAFPRRILETYAKLATSCDSRLQTTYHPRLPSDASSLSASVARITILPV